MYNNNTSTLYHYGVKGMKWGKRRNPREIETDRRNNKRQLKESKKKYREANKEWSKAYDKVARNPIANLFNTKKGKEYGKKLDSASQKLYETREQYAKQKKKYKEVEKLAKLEIKDLKTQYKKELAAGQNAFQNAFDKLTAANQYYADLKYNLDARGYE